MTTSALDRLQHARLGFGTAPLASAFWGNERSRAIDAVVAAIDAGYTWFDTAPLYGAGEAEERLGAALAARPSADVGVATKVGRTIVGDDVVFDFSEAAIRAQVESSLRRLGRDHVDVAHVHDPEDHLEAATLQAVPALIALREEGLVGAISVGTNVTETAVRFAALDGIDAVMLAGRITLLDRSGLPAVDACRDAGIPLIAAAPFNSGVLATRADDAWFDYAPVAPDVLRRARAMASACAEHDVDLRAAALQFPLRHAGVVGVIAGVGAAAEAVENLDLMRTPVPDELWERLDALA